MDEQDGQDTGLKHEQITRAVIGAPKLEYKRFTRTKDFKQG